MLESATSGVWLARHASIVQLALGAWKTKDMRTLKPFLIFAYRHRHFCHEHTNYQQL
jgi:hypothetical protein